VCVLVLFFSFSNLSLGQLNLSSSFLQDTDGSQLARTFSENVAEPLIQIWPRTYKPQSVQTEMQVTGFFTPEEFDFEARKAFREGVAATLNDLVGDNYCCILPDNVTVTNVCAFDYTQCTNYMFRARPSDCGDAKRFDPEECDDGNIKDGDGCSSACSVEDGFFCVGGTRFASDVCTNITEAGLIAAANANVRRDGRGPNRRLMQVSSNIIVSFRVSPGVMNGSKTLTTRKLWRAMTGGQFLSQFTIKMRSYGYTLIVRWTATGEPELDLYTGSPRAFFNELISGKDISHCINSPFGGEDGSACAYLDFVMWCTVLGLGLASFMLVTCCGFWCGRTFPCCAWCGALCGQPGCGGPIPTKRRRKPEIFRANIALVVNAGLILSMSVLGFRATVQVTADVQTTMASLDEAQSVPGAFKIQLSNQTAAVKISARKQLDTVNERLSGLPELLHLNTEVKATLLQLAERLQTVQQFIEGGRNLSSPTVIPEGITLPGDNTALNPCVYYDGITDEPLVYDTDRLTWTRPNGEESVDATPDGKHIADGIPAHLENRRENPACSNHGFDGLSYIEETRVFACPCCRDCTIFQAAVQGALAGLPSTEDLLKLNQTLDTAMTAHDIGLLLDRMDAGVNVLDVVVVQVNEGLTSFKASMDLVLRFMAAIHIWMWGTSWLALFLLLTALIRTSYRYLNCVYVFGVVICSFVMFPIVGFGAFGVIPFDDFCQGIPRTGADTSAFLGTFAESGDVMDVNASFISVLQDCLTRPDGYIWSIASINPAILVDGLARFDLKQRADPQNLKALNTNTRDLTKPFTNHIDPMTRMTADNKIYGFDTMPLVPSSAYEGPTPIRWQVGGVINSINGQPLLATLNTILATTYRERQVMEACGASRPTAIWLQDTTQEEPCRSNESSVYGRDCCTVDTFWGGSQPPARVIYDYNIFRDELRDKIRNMQDALFSAETLLRKMKLLAAVLETNITRMVTEADATVLSIADDLLELSSCEEFNTAYEKVRTPVCDRLSPSVSALWIVCLLTGLSWIPAFFVINRMSKIFMLAAGLGKVAPRPQQGKKNRIMDDDDEIMFRNGAH